MFKVFFLIKNGIIWSCIVPDKTNGVRCFQSNSGVLSEKCCEQCVLLANHSACYLLYCVKYWWRRSIKKIWWRSQSTVKPTPPPPQGACCIQAIAGRCIGVNSRKFTIELEPGGMTDRGAARAEGGIVSAMSVSSLIERCVIERCRLIILKTVREGEILSSAKPQHRRDATSDERRRPTKPLPVRSQSSR